MPGPRKVPVRMALDLRKPRNISLLKDQHRASPGLQGSGRLCAEAISGCDNTAHVPGAPVQSLSSSPSRRYRVRRPMPSICAARRLFPSTCSRT